MFTSFKDGRVSRFILPILISALFVAASVEAATTISTNIATDGTLTVQGNAVFYGNATLGNAATDSILTAGAFQASSTALFGSGFTTYGNLTVDRSATTSVSFNQAGMSFDAGVLVIDPYMDRIGVGTTTPGSLLSLNALANFTTATSTFYSTGGINLSNGCFAVNDVCISGGGGGTPGGSDTQVQFNSSDAFAGDVDFIWNNTTKRLGLGTSTPGARLSVAGAAGTAGPVFLVSTSTAASATSTVFVIDANGRVAIGTTSPAAAPLTVVNSSDAVANRKLAVFSNTDGWSKHIELRDQGGSIYLGVNDGGTFIGPNTSSGAGMLNIRSTGNVGIGDASADYALDVYGTICQDTNSDDTCDGAVTSDARLKTGVEAISSPLAKLTALRGVYFDWDASDPATAFLGRGTRQVGLIAQEVESIFPSLVYEDMQGYKMVDYQKLTAPLIEAVKEMNRIITFTSASTSIPSIYIDREGNIQMKKVTARELCLDDICIDKEQLRRLLQSATLGEQ